MGDDHGHEPGEHGEHEHGEHEHGEHGRSGLFAGLRHLVTPHSHDHADSLDNALVTSARGITATKISLVLLAVTAIGQAAVFLVSGSIALLADTIHNISDAFTSVPLWIAFALRARPPSRRFTYGLGRLEDLAGIVIVLFIAGSAVLAGIESLEALREPTTYRNVWLVGIAGVIGFIGNEAVAIYRIRVGREIGSAALIADGNHARTDGITSLGVLVSAVAAGLGFPQVDAIVGLVITVAIAVILVGAARDVFRRLLDAVDPELVEDAERQLLAVDGVLGIDVVRMRWVGHRLLAEADIRVSPELSVGEGHHIAELARHELLHGVKGLDDVTVHVSPTSPPGQDDVHQLAAHHRPDQPSPPAGGSAG